MDISKTQSIVGWLKAQQCNQESCSLQGASFFFSLENQGTFRLMQNWTVFVVPVSSLLICFLELWRNQRFSKVRAVLHLLLNKRNLPTTEPLDQSQGQSTETTGQYCLSEGISAFSVSCTSLKFLNSMFCYFFFQLQFFIIPKSYVHYRGNNLGLYKGYLQVISNTVKWFWYSKQDTISY